MPEIFNTVGIVGAGAWGTCLAQTLRMAGRNVLVWAREDAVVESINKRHENADYLRGVRLDEGIKASKDFAALAPCEVLFLCPPAQHMETLCKSMAPAVKRGIPIVVCSKGIDGKTGGLMTEITGLSLAASPTAVLSGPSLAIEVARGLPTAVVVASNERNYASKLAETVAGPRLRPYTSDDMIGVQVGGAVKNVFAIAAGIVMGKGLGESARAALVTRGLSEMTALALALGGKMETLMGLSGVGDLVLTCGSQQSRNMSLGVALGRGDTLEKVLGLRHSVAEGVATAIATLIRAERHNVDMPLTRAIHDILHKGADVMLTMEQLLARPLTDEFKY